MRAACTIYCNQFDEVLRAYSYLSQHYYVYDLYMLRNSGLSECHLASSFVMSLSDSLANVLDGLSEYSSISKGGACMGIAIHNIRANGSYIRTTGGASNGIIAMIRIFNSTMRLLKQSWMSRKSRTTIYLEPWHADVRSFLELRDIGGSAVNRAYDLTYALWIPDLFMYRVENDLDWSLICPDESPGLSDVWGEDFNDLYTQYEEQKRVRKKIRARDLWSLIIHHQAKLGK